MTDERTDECIEGTSELRSIQLKNNAEFEHKLKPQLNANNDDFKLVKYKSRKLKKANLGTG